MNDLKEKVAVVFGGSGGIGRAAAREFAGAGAHVVVVYRSHAAEAEALAASLPGGGHLAVHAEMDQTPTIVAVAEAVEQRFGRTDILVNSAGFTKPIPHHDLDALDDDFIDHMFEVNWRGQFAAVRAFRKMLEASGNGLIVNVSSISAQSGSGSNIAYCAVKAGIDSMTKSLARAFAPAIRVMAVSPGMVATEFVAGRDAAFNAKAGQTVPLKRVAEPEDVGRAILACATLLTYSTGSIILVDGGRSL